MKQQCEEINVKKTSNNLRVIAGKWRSRKLTFPDVEGLRPTSDRVRETLFNWLQNHIVQEDCLDLFAGSGACGIEALSRDARHVTFIDTSASALAAIRDNLTLLGAENHDLQQQDSLRWLQDNSAMPEKFASEQTRHKDLRQYGVVFVDPPFAAGLLERVCLALESSCLLKTHALVYLESGSSFAQIRLPKNWQVLKTKQAGAVFFCLCQRVR